jgi:hypothetical protein
MNDISYAEQQAQEQFEQDSYCPERDEVQPK